MNHRLVTALVIALLTAVPPASAQPQGFREFVISVWSYSRSTSAGRTLLGQLASGGRGRQSRDIGDQILDLAVQGGVIRYPECAPFVLEFFDASGEIAAGPSILVNGVPRPIPPSGKNEIAVEVCGRDSASGAIAIPVNPPWNAPAIAVEVRSPFNLSTTPVIVYPGREDPVSRTYSLKTCGPQTIGRCGGRYVAGQPTSLWARLRTADVTYFHFVVD
ncbi:MAG: hypothetical protein HY474_01425 [Candidatus Sungbacteria bacterium]|uniref:Uncharacterized protein n=1 Tax=Candidatus Sungiibacteriota bacterium TaxID=2750080 RepID=A0A932YWC2_9BACT|nr:hypothetical protein [Candidatus Sungbacteria bacterium]